MIYPLLAIIFFLSLFLIIFGLICVLVQPTFWKKNLVKIKAFYLIWFSTYAAFIFLFTGPENLQAYPNSKTSQYKLPWKAGVRRLVAQGNRSITSHREFNQYAWDFVMENGTEVLAAREGQVVQVEDSFDGIGFASNFITVKHSDGEQSVYAHIRYKGSLATIGDNVQRGQPLALSGMVGQTVFPHLHFYVMNKEGTTSIPIAFSDVPSGVPLAGKFYTSGNSSESTTTNLLPPNFDSMESGCLIFVDKTDKNKLTRYGGNCEVRTPPCSTFKIALAEIGFRNKILLDTEQFKWDGIKRDREALNKNHNLQSWMKDSVVWVSSIIANRLVPNKLQAELKELSYGNALVGPNEFWIRGPLGISVAEQVAYLSRSSNDDLQKSIQLLPTEKVNAVTIYGKTGSCFTKNGPYSLQIGWYVGWTKSSTADSFFALRIFGTNTKTDGPSGAKAKTLFLDWLR